MKNNYQKNNVRKLRLKYNLTEKEMGEILCKSQQSVSRLENEKRDIGIDELNILANHFNVSTDFLLARTDVMDFPNIKDTYEKLILGDLDMYIDIKNMSDHQKELLINVIRSCISYSELTKK